MDEAKKPETGAAPAPAKPQEPEYYTLLAKPPKQKSKEDVEAAKRIASRYLGIQALEKIVNNKKAKKQKREAALRYKTPETPEEYYDRGQRYLGGAECAVPFQERVAYLRKAADMFAGAGEYNDAPELARKYRSLAEETEQDGYERAYEAAMERKSRAQSSDEWFEAARAFERIQGYQDADAQAAECQHVLDRRASLKKPLLLLKVAAVLALLVVFVSMSRTDRFQYQLARLAHRMGIDNVARAFLSSDNDYQDTDALLDEIYYDEAVERMEEGKYKSALNALEQCTLPHSDLQQRMDECNYALGDEAFTEGHNKIAKDHFRACSEGYRDCVQRIEECNYYQGLDSLAEEDLPTALDHFISANGYSDADEHCYELELQLLEDVRPGDTCVFAREEYTVLQRDGRALTLLCNELCSEEYPYNTEQKDVDWSECSLRSTLNSQAFLDETFLPQEQPLLQKTTVDGGTDTLYLLSSAEFLDYRQQLETSQEPAEPEGQEEQDDGDAENKLSSLGEQWWLRDRGDTPGTARFVSGSGELMSAGYPVDSSYIQGRFAVRIVLPE